jgi:PIN domain nuclease of toxin-antitoxin system
LLFDGALEASADVFELSPVTSRHAARAALFSVHRCDPFDRILAAQAEIGGLTLATNDGPLADFGTRTVW